jgi:hypothetical protein
MVYFISISAALLVNNYFNKNFIMFKTGKHILSLLIVAVFILFALASKSGNDSFKSSPGIFNESKSY